MARQSAKDTYLLIKDSTSASRNISGRSNTATLSFTAADVDITSFGAAYRERAGNTLLDWNLSIGGFWDGAASQVDEILQGIVGACTSACYGPGGSTSGQIQYSGCAILQDYTVETSVEGAVTFSATFAAASVLNRGTWA